MGFLFASARALGELSFQGLICVLSDQTGISHKTSSSSLDSETQEGTGLGFSFLIK